MKLDLQPPGSTERVEARSALVLAPHYDDEIVGCGGLLAQLVDGGAVVRVLFLSDSTGGVETVEDARGYGRRRRAEAKAVAGAMGFAGLDHLGLPDGELDRRLDEVAAGIRRAILTQRPDLLLVPSPLEITRDHRAVFAALHRLLAPVRRSGQAGQSRRPDALADAVSALDILVYEVNHPQHPDLLVDVGDEIPRVEAALALHESQLQRHDYVGAMIGLRKFRTLSLGPGVEAAEAYRRLTVEDFVTRSPAQLVSELGGRPEILEVLEGPPVSVVVRTFNRPELLAEALHSLEAGSYRRVEVVLVNDGGETPEVPEGYSLPLVRVDLPENLGRAAAADAGVEAASGDYIAFLDDDDLAAPEHLATLAGAVSAAGVRVAYSDAAVGVYELDGEGWVCRERRLPYSRDFDPDLLLLDNFIPFNTLLIERGLFAAVGPLDRELPFFEDWDFLIRLAALTPFHHLPRVTCEYRHFRGGGHHILGERPRQREDFLAMKAKVLAKHAEKLPPEGLVRAVDTLRGELVEEREAAAALRSSEADLRRRHRGLEDRLHRLNGELEAIGADYRRVKDELQRLYDEEKKLRKVAEDQTAHLGRTYGEIERLTGLLQEMEKSRVWRFHQWWQRRTR